MTGTAPKKGSPNSATVQPDDRVGGRRRHHEGASAHRPERSSGRHQWLRRRQRRKRRSFAGPWSVPDRWLPSAGQYLGPVPSWARGIRPAGDRDGRQRSPEVGRTFAKAPARRAIPRARRREGRRQGDPGRMVPRPSLSGGVVPGGCPPQVRQPQPERVPRSLAPEFVRLVSRTNAGGCWPLARSDRWCLGAPARHLPRVESPYVADHRSIRCIRSAGIARRPEEDSTRGMVVDDSIPIIASPSHRPFREWAEPSCVDGRSSI